VNYLLDTNVCIALINRRSTAVRSRFQRAVGSGAQIYVSAVVAFELWYGVAKSINRGLN
jgi:tRNA(fMet)-specific endonuclease VapC